MTFSVHPGDDRSNRRTFLAEGEPIIETPVPSLLPNPVLRWSIIVTLAASLLGIGVFIGWWIPDHVPVQNAMSKLVVEKVSPTVPSLQGTVSTEPASPSPSSSSELATQAFRRAVIELGLGNAKSGPIPEKPTKPPVTVSKPRTAIAAPNQTSTKLMGLSEDKQKRVWTLLLENQKCDRVVRTMYQGGTPDGEDNWSVACQNGSEFSVGIAPDLNGSAKVISCNELTAMDALLTSRVGKKPSGEVGCWINYQ